MSRLKDNRRVTLILYSISLGLSARARFCVILSELDWRLRRSGTQASDLLGSIWQSIEQEFQGASNQGRCTILGILEGVAVYQPEKTLEMVEYAIRTPATKSEDPYWSKVYEFNTHSDVLRQLAHPIAADQLQPLTFFLAAATCYGSWEGTTTETSTPIPTTRCACSLISEAMKLVSHSL